MAMIPKYRLCTTIAIERKTVLDYFDSYIDYESDNDMPDSFICKDGSLLFLKSAGDDEKVYVKFYCNLQVNKETRSVSFDCLYWFLVFCRQNECLIKNLSSEVLMPASEGVLLSDLFSSKAFRKASHYATHPKDVKLKDNRK